MDKLQKKRNNEIDVLMVETEEVYYDLDKLMEYNNDLIKYEFNMIELPFFTKDKKVENAKGRKYNFSVKDNSYLKITPSGNPDLISNKLPQEFDEKIFYAILKMSREQKTDSVITDYYTLAKVAGVPYEKLERIKDSIERLENCKIEVNNIFYNAELREIFKAGKLSFSLLQSVSRYTFRQVLSFPEDKRDFYAKYFANRQIAELLILTLSKEIYKNIENKGFLYFDQKKLLGIDNAVARKLFLMLTKWQGWEKKYTMRRSCRFLASRIPLSWEKKSVTSTIASIENAFELLKKKQLIKGYVLYKTKPADDSYFDINFKSENGDKLLEYNRQAARDTGHEDAAIEFYEEVVAQTNIFDISINNNNEDSGQIEKLYNLIPVVDRTAFIKDLVQQFFLKRGELYVSSNISYCIENAKDFSRLFPLALENDYAEKDRLLKSEKEKILFEKKEKEAAERKIREENERKENEFREWWKTIASEKEKLEIDIIAKKMMLQNSIPENFWEHALLSFRILAWFENEKEFEESLDWFNSQEIDTKEKILASFQKHTGITEQHFDMTSSEKMMFRSFIRDINQSQR